MRKEGGGGLEGVCNELRFCQFLFERQAAKRQRCNSTKTLSTNTYGAGMGNFSSPSVA